MKKVTALVLSILMAVSLFTACGSEEAATDTSAPEPEATEAADEERTTFTVGFDSSFPPYGYEDENGELVGFDLDLAAEVCARNGWELIKTPINWDAKDNELNSGAIDCIWNGFTINGRENDYTWTEPYMNNSQVYVVKSDSGIETPADLKDKNILVQAASSALTALEDPKNKELMDSFANLDEVPDYNAAFLDLESGAGDAIAMDVGVARYQIENRDSAQFTILEEALDTTEQYGIGFKLGNEELRDKVQTTLKAMVGDGKFKEIADKYGLADSVCLEA
ncbi:MAG: amino acid ABC transporter substrate-binding protein [Lachnoclostridium sp.]|jgi:polar amino acid transport system substrate-binding protein|nr:amino acid ABC transporter substrate-binding protein [Lachnoclostridium sp.]